MAARLFLGIVIFRRSGTPTSEMNQRARCFARCFAHAHSNVKSREKAAQWVLLVADPAFKNCTIALHDEAQVGNPGNLTNGDTLSN